MDPAYANDESAGSEEPIRCQLFANLGNPYGGSSLLNPSLVIEVVRDSMRVIDPVSNALTASASLAQVTATPENYSYFDAGRDGGDGGGYGGRSVTMPVLVVGVPGLQPLTVQPRHAIETFFGWHSRFWWRAKVPGVTEQPGTWAEARRPAYLATDDEWLTLVEKLGLGTLVADDPKGGIRMQWVIVLAFVALTLVLMLWAIIH